MAYYNGKKVLSVVKVVGKPKEFIKLNDGGIKVLDDAKVTAVFTSPYRARTSGGVRLYKKQYWGTKKANEISKVANNVHDCSMATFLATIFGIDQEQIEQLTADAIHERFPSYGINDLFPKEYKKGVIDPETGMYYAPEILSRKFYYFESKIFYDKTLETQFSVKTHSYLTKQLIDKSEEQGLDEANARFMVKFVKDYEKKQKKEGCPYWVGQMSDYWLEVQIRVTELQHLFNNGYPARYFINVYPRKF